MRQDQIDSVIKKKPGKQPDYHVHALDQSNEARARIGAAWINDDKSISIKLDPFIVLTSAPTLMIRLFVNDGTLRTVKKSQGQPTAEGVDNDTPF